jgi:hypothetical protein
MDNEFYYRFLLGKIDDLEYFESTNDAKELEKRKLLSVKYPKIHVKVSSKPVPVMRADLCDGKYVHEVLKREYNAAVLWDKKKKGSLEAQLEFDNKDSLKRHLEALDGYHWNHGRDSPCF